MQCPTCKKAVKMPAPGEPMGAFPFCCDRCRLIDLGRWLDGKYQIPVVEEDDDRSPPGPPAQPPDDGVDPDSNGGPRPRPRPPHPY